MNIINNNDQDRKYSIKIILFKIVIFLFIGPNLAFGKTIDVPKEYATIQAAVGIASSGDTIRIQPGVYNESVTILDKSKSGITLEGVDKITTIINPKGSNRGISILITNNVTIRNLTITGGNPQNSPYSPTIGGGIFVDGSNNIVVSSCLITNNNAVNGAGFGSRNSSIILDGNTIKLNKASSTQDARGGGAFIYESHGVISNNIFEENKTSGPIMGPGGGLFIQKSDPTVSGNIFSKNQAAGSQHYGGGLYMYESKNFTVSNNTFRDNVGLDGGGMAAIESNPTITGNIFINNQARWGGGIYGWHMSSLIATNTFNQNKAIALGNDPGGGGGILFDESSNSVFTGNILIKNLSTDWGGGIDLYKSSCKIFGNTIRENQAPIGAGAAITPDSDGDFSNNIIENNLASEVGGGIFVGSNSNPTIRNNLIADNKANLSGGGVVIYIDSSPKIVNNTFYLNQAPETQGGTIRIDRSAPTLENNIFYGITGAEAISAAASKVQLAYNSFYKNKSPYLSFSSTFSPVIGNITTDPKFLEPDNRDFHVQPSSLCLHNGNPSSVFNNPNGTRNTIGMYGGPDAMVSYPVYRFLNDRSGGHFFTISEDEKDIVNAHYKWLHYEGIGFYGYLYQYPGTSPVYRFLNDRSGGHFFTISEAEKDIVIAHYKWLHYEGIGFYAYPYQEKGTLPVHRFLNDRSGGHFFTISEAEKDIVIAHYKWLHYEGVGFFLNP